MISVNKKKLNNLLGRFGLEIHGKGYMQSLRRDMLRSDAFMTQRELLSGKAKVIFDVGANYGDTVLRYRELFPDAQIYAFEPFPEVFNSLKDKVKGLSNIKVSDNAISDSEGTAVFNVNNNVDTNSLLESGRMGLRSDFQVANKYKIEVITTTLDHFCIQNGVEYIDILKLDIQGGEFAALKGAEQLLRSGKVRLIYAETYFWEQYLGQPLFYDIAVFLQKMGYNLQDIYNPIYGDGCLAWCDAMFLKK